jgi:hypothetical protein
MPSCSTAAFTSIPDFFYSAFHELAVAHARPALVGVG